MSGLIASQPTSPDPLRQQLPVLSNHSPDASCSGMRPRRPRSRASATSPRSWATACRTAWRPPRPALAAASCSQERMCEPSEPHLGARVVGVRRVPGLATSRCILLSVFFVFSFLVHGGGSDARASAHWCGTARRRLALACRRRQGQPAGRRLAGRRSERSPVLSRRRVDALGCALGVTAGPRGALAGGSSGWILALGCVFAHACTEMQKAKRRTDTQESSGLSEHVQFVSVSPDQRRATSRTSMPCKRRRRLHRQFGWSSSLAAPGWCPTMTNLSMRNASSSRRIRYGQTQVLYNTHRY